MTSQAQFDRAEREFTRADHLPLAKQPLDGLEWRYKTLATDPTLPTSMRQVAERRTADLAVRIDARRQMLATDRQAAADAAREQALAAEQRELADRVKSQQVATYAAVGTLRVSSLQQSGPTLYRLTDPNSGNTLIYVRTTDRTTYDGLLGQFIGVRGNVTVDAATRLRYVTPTAADVVEVAKVNNGVVAAFTPPSLLARGPVATAGSN